MAADRDAPPGGAPGEGGGELHAAPPFFTWRTIYAIVLGALALQVVVYAALTAIYR